ncbi:MAG: cupin domain-containing protein [Symploca sp. SIO2G7]|nr:cupin domain-containing protein [Symploca sp. SIO2G7]
MVATLAPLPTMSTYLPDQIHYSASGVYSQILSRDSVCRSSLFCLTAGTAIKRQTIPHNAMIYVIEGTGELLLNRDLHMLESGRFIVVPAQCPYTLTALCDMTFMLILSKVP